MNNQNSDLLEGFKTTELGPLPEDWQVVSLGDVFIEVDNRVAKFSDSNADRFPVLSLTKNYGLMLQSERFGKRIALENVDDYKVVKSGEIVYNPYVIWEGAIHILDRFDYGLVSPVYPVLETNQEHADPYFLDMMLRTPLAIAAYNRFAAGAVNRRRSIRKTDFMAIKIPLPSLPEQKAIARVLSTIQKAIEAQDKIITAARELKKSLMRHLFTYGLVRVSEAEQVPLKETVIGPVPEHWEILRFTDSIQRSIGETPKSILASDYKSVGMYPIIDQGEKFICGYTDDNSRIYFGDLPLVIFGDHTRVFKFIDFPFAIGADGTKIIHPRKDMFLPKFFYYYLSNLDIPSRGYNRHYKILKEQMTIRPTITEQEEIARMLLGADKKIEAEEKRKESLQALFKTMLHLLMTGKVRVKDLEVMAA